MRLLAAMAMVVAMPAPAHLIDAQRGTLNIIDGGGFLVLSVPVSAFGGVDDDGDSALSMAELRRHQKSIEAQVAEGITLGRDDGPPITLDGVMFTLSPEHGAMGGVARHLVVMGRFALPQRLDAFSLDIRLFGRGEGEQRYVVSITRGRAGHVATLTPNSRQGSRLHVQ